MSKVTQSAYVRRVIRAMKANGWTLTGASNGEEWTRNPSEREALSVSREADEGAIRFKHETYGVVTLLLVWEYEGEWEDVIYDYRASKDGTLDEVARIMESVEPDAEGKDTPNIFQREAEAARVEIAKALAERDKERLQRALTKYWGREASESETEAYIALRFPNLD